MNLLILISLASGILALFFFGRMFRCLRRGHVLRAGGSGLSCCATGAVCTAGVVLLASVLSYGRLVDEQQISSIEFRRIATQEFEARLMIDGEQDRLFVLSGDEWQMDARIVTWQPPLTILGLDPLYMLDRLSGRYAEIENETSRSRTAHSLAPQSPIDIWQAARRFPVFTPGVDAYYGTATFLPMADGARFDISLSRDALIARPANARASAAVGEWSPAQ